MSVLLIVVGVIVFELVLAVAVGKFLKRGSPPEPLPCGLTDCGACECGRDQAAVGGSKP